MGGSTQTNPHSFFGLWVSPLVSGRDLRLFPSDFHPLFWDSYCPHHFSLIGKNLYSSRTGFLGGLILATSFEFAFLSTRANIDTTLTFFTTASLFCFFQWYRYCSPQPIPLPSGGGR